MHQTISFLFPMVINHDSTPLYPQCKGDVATLQSHRSTGAKKQHEEPEVWTTSGRWIF